jgi:hypothetical protein
VFKVLANNMATNPTRNIEPGLVVDDANLAGALRGQ